MFYSILAALFLIKFIKWFKLIEKDNGFMLVGAIFQILIQIPIFQIQYSKFQIQKISSFSRSGWHKY